MKKLRNKSFIFTVLLLTSELVVFSQSFINLNFESANIIPIVGGPNYPYDVTSTNALPGWTVYYGLIQQSQITYNDPGLGSTLVTLWATNGAQISGNYSPLLQGGLTASAATISQTGLVPVGTASLLFEAQQGGSGTLQVSLGGQVLSFFALSTGANYTLYGANISAFAGLTEQLMFSALNTPGIYPNNWNIDNIQFSSSPVPEPSMFALIGLGGMFLACLRWRKLSS